MNRGAVRQALAPECAAEVLRASALAPGEARALLAHALGVAREQLIAHPETNVDAPARERFARLAAQRRRGVPMAYLLQVQEFFGHALHVTPAVLIPRPDTELLVETALGVLAGRRDALVLELGTGSGCVAVSLALARPDLLVAASDSSAAALQVARENCVRLGASVLLFAGDWLAPVGGRFDLIVSNPPYVAAADPHLEALCHEPRAALTDGADGLSALRTIIGGAAAHLAPGGCLLVEHGYDQGAATRQLMREHGFTRVRTLRDLAGRERACLGEENTAESARAGTAAR